MHVRPWARDARYSHFGRADLDLLFARQALDRIDKEDQAGPTLDDDAPTALHGIA